MDEYRMLSVRGTVQTRLLVSIFVSIFAIGGIVVNIIRNNSAFNLNEQLVRDWQSNEYLNTNVFKIIMNLASNIFNPILCAGYLILLYLISHRKLQILVFLNWFLFVSFALSLLKLAIQYIYILVSQARPYWNSLSGIKMLQWTCYMQFGCPSGHSMLGLILIEFLIKLFCQIYKLKLIWKIGLYAFGLIAQGLIMFSRMFLGMHSLNQVLFGMMLGFYLIVIYYVLLEKLILRLIIYIFRNPKSNQFFVIMFILFCLFTTFQILLTFLIKFQNQQFISYIKTIQNCKNFDEFKSFHYRCLQDSSIICSMFGLFTAFNFLDDPSCLAKPLVYSRVSFRFFKKIIVTFIVILVPVGICLNPFWNLLQIETSWHALLIWGLQSLGLYSGAFFLIKVAPMVCKKLHLEQYASPNSYQNFKKYEVINMGQEETNFIKRKAELENTELAQYRHRQTLGVQID